jgi:hypothetical protein
MQCPECNHEVEAEDFGMTTCDSCGAIFFVNMTGEVEVPDPYDAGPGNEVQGVQEQSKPEEANEDFGVLETESQVSEGPASDLLPSMGDTLESAPHEFMPQNEEIEGAVDLNANEDYSVEPEGDELFAQEYEVEDFRESPEGTSFLNPEGAFTEEEPEDDSIDLETRVVSQEETGDMEPLEFPEHATDQPETLEDIEESYDEDHEDMVRKFEEYTPADGGLILDEMPSSEFVYDIFIGNIETAEDRKLLLDLISDEKLGLNSYSILESIKDARLDILQVVPVKASVLITRLRPYQFELSWRQYETSEISSSDSDTDAVGQFDGSGSVDL